jgi:hypothetical protein
MYEALPGTGFRTAVSYSGELRRIEALPRRRWVADPRVTDLLTEELRQPAPELRAVKEVLKRHAKVIIQGVR